MRMSKLIKYVSQIIFFGALWGIVEASMGYILHFIPSTVAGLIMFPIATFILVKAFKMTGSKASLLYIGLVAAAIKSVDFLLPGLSIYKTINPMLSIVLESLMVAVAYPAISSRKITKQAIGSIGASIGWRTIFVLYMVGQYILTGNPTKYTTSPIFALNFMLISGIISGVIAMTILWFEQKVDEPAIKRWEVKPAYAIIALVVALGIQYMI